MIIGRDIIVIGIQPWDLDIDCNIKNISIEMSKYNRILYVNSPIDRKIKKNIAKTDKNQLKRKTADYITPDLVKVAPNIWNLIPKQSLEYINWLPDGILYDFINKRNNRKFAADIQSSVKELHFTNYIIFNDSNIFNGFHQKELLKPRTFVYYMRGYLTKNPYWAKHGARLEPLLIEKADVVLSNTILFTEYGRQFNKHSYMVGQGCDVSLFKDDQGTMPTQKNMLDIKKPIIGYVGKLSSRQLDINLLVYIAKRKPEWSFILIGPEDNNFKTSELHQINNVHFIGRIEENDLPSYIKSFDVAINPQLVNDVTNGNYPENVDKFLAMGKPIVATATKAMEYFSEYTNLAKSQENWLESIDKALKEDSESLKKDRIKCGTSHSWENNVKEIFKYIECFEKGWTDI